MTTEDKVCPQCGAVGFLRPDNMKKSEKCLFVTSCCDSCHKWSFLTYNITFVDGHPLNHENFIPLHSLDKVK